MATDEETLRDRLDTGTIIKVSLAVFLVLAAGWFAYALTRPAPTEGSVSDVKQNPDQYVGETVSLQGEVVRTTDNGYVYSDGTGEIRVISENPPQESASVGMVQGTVERRNDELVIVEKTRM